MATTLRAMSYNLTSELYQLRTVPAPQRGEAGSECRGVLGAGEGVFREKALPASQRHSLIRQQLQVQPNSEMPWTATLVPGDSGILNKPWGAGTSRKNLSRPRGSDLYQLESTFSLWTDLLPKRGRAKHLSAPFHICPWLTETHTHTQKKGNQPEK